MPSPDRSKRSPSPAFVLCHVRRTQLRSVSAPRARAAKTACPLSSSSFPESGPLRRVSIRIPVRCTGTRASFRMPSFRSLSKKSLQTFLPALLPPRILASAQMRYPEKGCVSAFFGRRLIVLEAGLAPSSSPAALSVDMAASFFDSLRNEGILSDALVPAVGTLST